MKLEAASTTPPKTLREFLTDLGDGENGFMGTRVPAGEVSLEDYLQQCCAMTDETMLRPGLVPQTTFWALSDVDGVVGMVRMRHYLNDNLRIHGGHIGYYIRRDQRDKGYGKKILALALAELQKLGEKRALITTSGDNARSIRVIEANGGQFCDLSSDAGAQYRRYWIDLASEAHSQR